MEWFGDVTGLLSFPKVATLNKSFCFSLSIAWIWFAAFQAAGAQALSLTTLVTATLWKERGVALCSLQCHHNVALLSVVQASEGTWEPEPLCLHNLLEWGKMNTKEEENE